jgi:hypothetical protein
MSTNIRLFLPTLAASLLGAATLHAADAPAAPAAPTTAPAKADAAPADSPANVKAETETYQLKNRSAFNCPTTVTRAPFWPIGWVPQTKGTVTASTQSTPKVALDAGMFRVTSILLGSGATGSLAVINGRAYSEGEFIKMPRVAAAVSTTTGKATNPATRIRVMRITDGTVLLQRDDQTVTLTLQRPELAQRKPEEPLLDEEER